MHQAASKTVTLRQVIAACGVTYVALTGLANAPAQARTYRTLRMDAVGCRERQTFLDAMKLNPDEFATLIVRKAGMGECSVFLKGDAVTLDQADLSGALYCLRPLGNARCYWTFRVVLN
jgi:hypothetical protein